jgi:Flp pilus assembly CpaF family ATPase
MVEREQPSSAELPSEVAPLPAERSPVTSTAPHTTAAESDVVKQAAQRLLDLIADDDCTEILLNGPQECLRKEGGVRYHCPDVAFPDVEAYHAALNEYLLPHINTPYRIGGPRDTARVIIEGPLTARIPGVEDMHARVHIVCPPGVDHAVATIAKKPRRPVTLDDMVTAGGVSADGAAFLKAIARGHQTFVVSGATGAGKSTLLQALTQYFDPNDRVVVVEETPELELPLGDVVYLKSSLELPGTPADELYSLEFWVKQANRMRMDRVIVGETRGAEVAEWLIAANSGAEGSATTTHSESPRRCLDKILSLAAKSTTASSEQHLLNDIAATIDIIVQVAVVDGRHYVTNIEEVSRTVTVQTGRIQTSSLFALDRETLTLVPEGRPSDYLIAALERQGVAVDPQWFRR